MSDEAYGYCECGCGQRTGVWARTERSRGRVKGQPKRYIVNHHGRKAEVRYDLDPLTGCWVWQRRLDRYGYGKLRHNHREVKAHRFVYELHRGPIPEGLTLDHLCRNRACVNPEHLEPVTHAENCRRSPLIMRGPSPEAGSSRSRSTAA